MEQPVRIVCREDKTERLLAELATSELDMVIRGLPTCRPKREFVPTTTFSVNAALASTDSPSLTKRHKRDFPKSLDGAPLLLPTENNVIRRALDHWFDDLGVRPRIIAEFEDSALLKQFGHHGEGLFPAPSAIEPEIIEQYGVRVVGRTERITERFYAITVERRIKHPAVRVISEAAHDDLFA